MALTFTIEKDFALPLAGTPTQTHISVGYFNLGNPYAAGGIALGVADVAATCASIDHVVVNGVSLDGQVQMVWNSGTAKIMAFDATTNAEFGAVDLSGAGRVARAQITWT